MTRSFLRCSDPACAAPISGEVVSFGCPRCAGLLEVAYEWDGADPSGWPELWRERRNGGRPMDRSGVWRFRELLPFLAAGFEPVSLGEGSTALVEAPRAAAFAGLRRLQVKHQGTNPTGSFKDLGMTACISHAVSRRVKVVACASTGNTSSSMAAYAARAGIRALLFVSAGGVSSAKLAQALEFGALTIETGQNFDEALRLLRSVAGELGWYVVNSINPYRLEGQKTVVAELLEQRHWRPPDYLVLPGGNLGNVSALGKGLRELSELGLLSKVPRLVVVQASGADPFFQMWRSGARNLQPLEDPQTRATAIRIGNPANWTKALRVLEWSEGLCEAVTDLEIAAAKVALTGDGIGAEPASATTVAGLRRLREKGQIEEGADVVALLTGHQLKDVDYILERGAEAGPAPGLRLDPDPETAPGILSDWLAGLV
ncbi:MAG: threonine synthase [Candidatus Dormibacteria bacterium]|jgi:threonine synthase